LGKILTFQEKSKAKLKRYSLSSSQEKLLETIYIEASVFIFGNTKFMRHNTSEEALKYYLYKRPAITFLWEMFDGKKSVGGNTFVTAD